jgi:hypothetical protein
MATLAEVQDRIASEMGRSDLSSSGSNAAISKGSILDAISAWRNWRFTFNELTATMNTIIGTSVYTTSNGLPSGILEIDEVTVIDNGSVFPMKEISASQYALINATNPSTRGTPQYYSWYGDSMRIYPASDRVYELNFLYHGELPVLSLGTDQNAWTNKAEYLIRHAAKADLCANVVRDTEAAQLAQETVQLAFKTLRREYENKSMTGFIDPEDC